MWKHTKKWTNIKNIKNIFKIQIWSKNIIFFLKLHRNSNASNNFQIQYTNICLFFDWIFKNQFWGVALYISKTDTNILIWPSATKFLIQLTPPPTPRSLTASISSSMSHCHTTANPICAHLLVFTDVQPWLRLNLKTCNTRVSAMLFFLYVFLPPVPLPGWQDLWSED